MSDHHGKPWLVLVVYCAAFGFLVIASQSRRTVIDDLPGHRAPMIRSLDFDFGHAVVGAVQRCEFEVTNAADTDLRLDSQSATNHVALIKNQTIVPAGGGTVIEAEYRCARIGPYRSWVDLTSNAGDYDILRLVVTGIVDPAPSAQERDGVEQEVCAVVTEPAAP